MKSNSIIIITIIIMTTIVVNSGKGIIVVMTAMKIVHRSTLRFSSSCHHSSHSDYYVRRSEPLADHRRPKSVLVTAYGSTAMTLL